MTVSLRDVDYSCYKCGQAVAEGAPFCPHCGAPQIRVNVPEPTETMPETTSPTFAPGTPAEMQPPARPVSLAEAAGGIDWIVARKCALIAGVFVGVGAFLPLSFILIAFGGWLAVRIYNGWSTRRIQSAGDGAKLGVLSGFVGCVVVAISMIVVLRFWSGAFWNWLSEQMRLATAAGRDLTPMKQMMGTSEGRVAIVLALMIGTFLLLLVVSAIGGALGGTLAGRSKRR